MRGQKRVEDARERAYHPRIHRENFFEADGLPGHLRVYARLRRAMPGNDEIAASNLAARRRAVFGHSHLTMSNSPDLLVPAARLRPGFASLLHSPRIEGWAERRETFGCSGTRRARHNAAYQAPSEAPCVP